LQESPDELAKALSCPAEFHRTHEPVLFIQAVMPGVDGAEAVAKDMEMENDFNIRTGEHHTNGEPALAPYAKS
jgi:hypothetical protein